MNISFKLIAASVVLGICAVSTSVVMAQQPAPRTVRVISYQGDMTMLLAAMPSTFGVMVGLELGAEGYQPVRVSLQDATVTDVMNAIVQSSTKYEWQQTGEFVDVWPVTGSNPLLETRISSFNVKDVGASAAFDQLFNLPEVQASMTALKLKRRAPEGASVKLTSSRFSLNLEGVTLRQALNRIAQESRIDIWVFRNYPNGFFSISSVDR